MKRFLVEFAMGTDLHGQNVTKAACKAVRNAISNCCLCGITDCLGVENLYNRMHIHVKLGSTNPEGIDVEQVKAELPLGTVDVECVQGGMQCEGLHVDEFGEGDKITMVIAALTVYIKD